MEKDGGVEGEKGAEDDTEVALEVNATKNVAPRDRPATMPRPNGTWTHLKIVLTGGPHSGKTSLLRELGLRGFRTVPEAAIGIIDDLVADLGRDGARAWRLAHVPQFQERIAHAQVDLELAARASSAATCFCDRGVVDGLAYMGLVGAPPTDFLLNAVADTRYDAVVLCEICLPFKPRANTGRTSDLQRAREIEASLVATYTELGYDIVRLPAVSPVAARADSLLAELARRGHDLRRS